MNKLYNEDYEKCLIGMMLTDNSIIDEIYTNIQKQFFFVTKLGIFYEKIIELYKENEYCDILMLANAFPKWAAEISELPNAVTTTKNFDFYVNQIKTFYQARKYKAFLESQIDKVSEKNISEQLSEADDIAITLMKESSKTEPIGPHQMCQDMIMNIEEAKKHQGELQGIDTGFESLNSKLEGLQLGGLTVIGARVSIGKTAFATQLFDNIVLKDTPSVMFSFEMSAKQIQNRTLADLTNIPLKKLKQGMLTMADFQRINQEVSKLYEKKFLIYDSTRISRDFKEVVSRIRIHAKKGYKVFFIDHLGLLRYENKSLDLRLQIGAMTNELHTLAQKLNICIVTLCQLQRAAEGVEPTLSSLKESGDIEQDADVVILLHRDRQKADEISIDSKVIIAKNREGGCGYIDFDFIPHLAKYREKKSA